MRQWIGWLLMAGLLLNLPSQAQETENAFDSLEASLTYQHGKVELPGGIATLTVPAGFKYLDAKQSEKVLVDWWGNPRTEQMTLGMLLPENGTVNGDSSYAFNIQYDAIGFVKDDDAADINYTDLLKDMQKETSEANADRQKEGFEPVTLVGWAEQPSYDKSRNILYWAKEVKFGKADVNTLNYNVRLLGRKGVIVLNAVSSMPNLALVKNDIPKVLNVVQFNEGMAYKDFNPDVDEVAAWTIGGLVAGKVLAKVGFFAVLLKFWKLIFLAVAGFFGTIWKRIRGRKNSEENAEEANEVVADADALPEPLPVAEETTATEEVKQA